MEKEETLDLILKGVKITPKFREKTLTFIQTYGLKDNFDNEGNSFQKEVFIAIWSWVNQQKTITHFTEIAVLVDWMKANPVKGLYSALWQQQIDLKFAAKDKKSLYLMAILFENQCLPQFEQLIHSFIKSSRHAMVTYVLDLLGFIQTFASARLLVSIYNQYHKKKHSVGQKSKYHLLRLAWLRKQDYLEFLDDLMPNFGFDNVYRNIETDKETITVWLNEKYNFVFQRESGVMQKTAPKIISESIISELKAHQKEIKKVAKYEPLKLEEAMIVGRKWDIEKWESQFLSHPLFGLLGQQLIWGLWNKANELICSFRIDEDFELLNVEEDEIDLAEGTDIRIIHPIQLENEEVEEWKSIYFENDKEPLFNQLNKPFYQLNKEAESREFVWLADYDSVLNSTEIKNYFEKRNWDKIQTYGGFLSFEKTFHSLDLVVELKCENVLAFYNNNPASLLSLTVKDIKRTKRILLKDIPSILFSELMADVLNVIGNPKIDVIEWN